MISGFDIGEEQDIDGVGELAGADLFVGEIDHGEVVLLEDPAGPALVHARDPGFEEPDALGARWCGSASGASATSMVGSCELVGEGGEGGAVDLGVVDPDIAGFRPLRDDGDRPSASSRLTAV